MEVSRKLTQLLLRNTRKAQEEEKNRQKGGIIAKTDTGRKLDKKQEIKMAKRIVG
jgi:hypothetical protein